MLNVVIIGGGIAGFSAAIGLKLSGHAVTLLEKEEEFQELGAGVQLLPNLARIMQSWNILDQIRDRSEKPDYLAFRSYRNGDILHNHRVNPIFERTYGFPYLNIHRYDILLILIGKAQQLGVRMETSSSVSHLDLAESVVTTTQGQSFKADLLVGADGERSFVRSVLLGQPYKPQATGKLVYRFTIDIEKVRADASLRDLVEPSAITVWLGPQRHVVAYEVKRGGLMNVALTCPDPIEGRMIFGPRPANMNEFRQIFSGWDPRFLRLLDMATEARFWTLLQLPQENRTWTGEKSHRVILIGDAAHAMTPYLAQGAAQAVEDGAFLGHLFDESVDPGDIPARLERFCERRQPRALAVRSRAQKAGEKYQLSDGADQELRDDQLREGNLVEGFPNPFADPVLTHWLYDYDVEADAASCRTFAADELKQSGPSSEASPS